MSDDRIKGPTSRPDDAEQRGESGGGAYPNPHSGKEEDGGFRGGGSHPFHEGGPSADEDGEQGENVNATTKDD